MKSKPQRKTSKKSSKRTTIKLLILLVTSLAIITNAQTLQPQKQTQSNPPSESNISPNEDEESADDPNSVQGKQKTLKSTK